ncbi:MAG: hypothetical protein PF637_01545 [Spirochaetes bacterium]|jgi:NRPS condensation-like uncharacterized protein|nr:hypothetical protein [Spirochaetota bacterium]
MRRKTSTLERFMFFFGRQYPLNFGFRLVISSDFDQQRAHEALTLLSKRHSLLYAHQEYTEGKQMEIVFPNELKLQINRAPQNLSWEDQLLECMTRRFDPFVGPLFSLDWRDCEEGSELFFVFQHGAADGIGAVWFIHDFLSQYNGLQVSMPENPIMPVLFDLLKDDVVAELLKRPEPEWKSEEPPPAVPFDMPPYIAPDFELRFFQIGREAVDALAVAAKQEGLTVNSFLGAKILKASSSIFAKQEGHIRTIQCPVDLRPYIKEEFHALAGVHNGIVKVACDCSESTFDIARTIQTGIAGNRAGMKDIEKYFRFRDSFDNVDDPESLMMSFPTDTPDYDFSFSNLGRTIILPKYGDSDVISFYGPVFTAVNNETVIGLNSTNGILRMSLIFDKKIEKADKYRSLGDSIDIILNNYNCQ